MVSIMDSNMDLDTSGLSDHEDYVISVDFLDHPCAPGSTTGPRGIEPTIANTGAVIIEPIPIRSPAPGPIESRSDNTRINVGLDQFLQSLNLQPAPAPDPVASSSRIKNDRTLEPKVSIARCPKRATTSSSTEDREISISMPNFQFSGIEIEESNQSVRLKWKRVRGAPSSHPDPTMISSTKTIGSLVDHSRTPGLVPRSQSETEIEIGENPNKKLRTTRYPTRSTTSVPLLTGNPVSKPAQISQSSCSTSNSKRSSGATATSRMTRSHSQAFRYSSTSVNSKSKGTLLRKRNQTTRNSSIRRFKVHLPRKCKTVDPEPRIENTGRRTKTRQSSILKPASLVRVRSSYLSRKRKLVTPNPEPQHQNEEETEITSRTGPVRNSKQRAQTSTVTQSIIQQENLVALPSPSPIIVKKPIKSLNRGPLKYSAPKEGTSDTPRPRPKVHVPRKSLHQNDNGETKPRRSTHRRGPSPVWDTFVSKQAAVAAAQPNDAHQEKDMKNPPSTIIITQTTKNSGRGPPNYAAPHHQAQITQMKAKVQSLLNHQNLVSRPTVRKYLGTIGMRPKSSKAIRRVYEGINQWAEIFFDLLCKNASRPSSMFTFKEFESSLRTEGLIGENEKLDELEEWGKICKLKKIRGVLIPREGETDTLDW